MIYITDPSCGKHCDSVRERIQNIKILVRPCSPFTLGLLILNVLLVALSLNICVIYSAPRLRDQV